MINSFEFSMESKHHPVTSQQCQHQFEADLSCFSCTNKITTMATRLAPFVHAGFAGSAIWASYTTNISSCEHNKDIVVKFPTSFDKEKALSYRPDLSQYEFVPWNVKKNERIIKNHALFDTLHKDGALEVYEVYRHKENQEIVALLKFGNKLNGYPGLLHGGISALVIDNSYGMLFMSLSLPPAFTANLDINYRKPIPEGSFCILRAKVDSIHGRKLRMSATIEDAETGVLQVESTTLFVNMRLSNFQQFMHLVQKYLNL